MEKHGDCFGLWLPLKNMILIEDNDETALSIKEQTFWHEAVHSILHYLGEEALNDNEVFVDRLSQALYQINKTLRTGKK